MKKIVLLLIVFLTIGRISAQITIVENTRDHFIFEWNIEKIDTTSVKTDNGRIIKPSFTGQNTVIGDFQKPVVPGYSFFVGIPSTGELQVSIEPAKTATYRLDYPVKLQSDSSKQLSLEFSKQWISNPVYSSVGAIRTAQCVIKPFLYDIATGNGTALLSARIRIDFPATGSLSIAKTETRSSGLMASLLLNYNIARGWATTGKSVKKSLLKAAMPFEQQTVFFKIGDGYSGLNEGTINENGIIKITGASLREIFGTSSQLPLSRVALYASIKGTLPETIPQNGVVADGVKEIPLLRYDLNGNNIIDDDDYCLGYVSGISDWIYNSGYTFKIDNYELSRTYWLTIKTLDGLAMTKYAQPSGNGVNVNYFTNRMFCKQSKLREYGSEGGNNWVWQKLTNNDQYFKYTFDFPLIDTTYPGLMSITTSTNYFNAYFADKEIVQDSASNYLITTWGNKTLSLGFVNNGPEYCELYDVKIEYRSALHIPSTASTITAFSSLDSGITHYQLSGVKNQNIFLFRVTNYEMEISLIDTIRNSVADTFTWSDSCSPGTRYIICNENGLINLPTVQSVSTVQGSYVYTDLRNTLNTADYLIISHPDFIVESNTLAAHKKTMGFNNPRVVSINDVYRWFSGGNKDPVAIRNFLSYAKKNWINGSDLMYVVLMGVGHHDPKNYISSATDFIPIYQNYASLWEDFFAFTESDSSAYSSAYGMLPQLVIGRFPCSTRDEAGVMVNKVVEMEDAQTADFSAWRNRAMFVADDDMQGNTYDGIMNTRGHYISSDCVFDTVQSCWPSMDMRKVYLFEYPWNSAGEKPGATQAILSEINNGVAYVNYFGHGANVLWADEHVLRKENISSMTNAKQYPLISSFSCDVGKFDDPGVDCLSAALVKANGAGASVTVSSTRLAYATENEQLALSFYSYLLDSSATVTGDAYFKAKAVNTSSSHRTYAFLGDPSLQIVKPEKKLSLAITDTYGKELDTLQALQQIKVKGSVLKSDLTIDNEFGNSTASAYVKIGLYNAPDTASRKDGGTVDERYLMPGTPIFAGKSIVKNGVFEQNIFLPRNISFGKPGAKLIAYAWMDKDRNVAVGNNNSIMFLGTDTSGSASQTDSSGPRISVRPVYDDSSLVNEEMSFTDGIVSILPVKFQIVLYDESGIDVSGSGPDEGLMIEIPGVLSKRTINSSFQFSEGDFREGSAPVELEKNSIQPGTYEMTIFASDLIGNVSQKKVSIEITKQDELKLNQVFNYPNPFRMGQTTRIFFYPSNTTYETLPVSVYVRIYSLSGKLLRVFTNAHNGMVWDGKDQSGIQLSPNIYLYQVTAYNKNYQKTIKSSIKKIVIHPPK